MNLFHKLNTEGRLHLRAADFLQISEHSLQFHESCAEEDLIHTFIRKLLMMNYKARYITTKETNKEDDTQQRECNSSEDESDIYNELSLSNKGKSQSERIDPMDIQMVAFHCADGFLKQLMVTKLSQCQYALPLLVPDPFTQQIEFPLWTFRQINKSWKIKNTNISQTQPIYKAETPMVFFFRFGSVSSSKSQLINSLITERHNTFFHRNCPGSSRTRELMDGVVEIAWFCPSGTNDDKFTDCVAFCNLHGDAGDHEKQLQILTESASVNVVLLTHLDRSERNKNIENLYKDLKPLICLFTEDESAIIETRKRKYKIGLKNRNHSEVSEELRGAIKGCLSDSSSTFSLKDLSKYSDIRVDEEDDDECRRGREAAQQMMSLLEKKDLTEIKESFLPHQGKLWHQWSQKNRELHRPTADETEINISRKHSEMRIIRQQQHETDISEFIKFFIKEMSSHAEHKMLFIKWLSMLLNEHTSADLSTLHHKYNVSWSTVLKLKGNYKNSEQLSAEQIKLEKISEELEAATFGLEHIMREIGQIYESCPSVKNENKKEVNKIKNEDEKDKNKNKSKENKNDNSEEKKNVEKNETMNNMNNKENEKNEHENEQKNENEEKEENEIKINENENKEENLIEKNEGNENENKEENEIKKKEENENENENEIKNKEKEKEVEKENKKKEENGNKEENEIAKKGENENNKKEENVEENEIMINENENKEKNVIKKKEENKNKENKEENEIKKKENGDEEENEIKKKEENVEKNELMINENENMEENVIRKKEENENEENKEGNEIKKKEESENKKKDDNENKKRENGNEENEIKKKEENEIKKKEENENKTNVNEEENEIKINGNENKQENVISKKEENENENKEENEMKKKENGNEEKNEIEKKEENKNEIKNKNKENEKENMKKVNGNKEEKRRKEENENEEKNEIKKKGENVNKEKKENENEEENEIKKKEENENKKRDKGNEEENEIKEKENDSKKKEDNENGESENKNKIQNQLNVSSLPSFAAEIMISGFPLELMDGDAAHVPVTWISAVLDELIQKLGDQRVFVLSVLGIQSSGKSTMLNAMFGLQFAVSAGRCTRGAFMQLLRVTDKMKEQLNFDYLLVVDTEGLHALELAGRSTRNHDNELATFVVGLANLTLINIFGENLSEMQDILQIVVQALQRMKKVRLNPSCVFVHQNISDITAGQKNMEGRRRLQEKLDELTKIAAKDEVCDAECFRDVIRFNVHNDVNYIAQLWEGSPPMAPPNPKYCENIQELKKTIMSHASKSNKIMLVDLKDHIKDLWEALLNERFVFSFQNSLEISAYKKLETEYSKWSWSLRSAMMETENELQNKIESEVILEIEETDIQREMKTTSEEVKKLILEFFETDKDKDVLIRWKTSFEIKISELQESIVRETKRKLNGILQQQGLKKKINAQRTHHENILFEKSKEIALKIRNKANNEETLKKEFDLFWKQWIKKIIQDTPGIKDIDIMSDVRRILSGIYGECLYLEPWKEGSRCKTFFSVPSFSKYVTFKTSKEGEFKKILGKVKGMFGFAQTLSPEDEAQIRSLVSNVVQQTDGMIQNFNISKMGYNIDCIQKLTDYITKSVTEHQEGPVKYMFKNEFFMDLVLSICERSNKMITDQHKVFRETNDPDLYTEKKREQSYDIFKKYCHGATSAVIFGEIICQKLKESIEQSVYKKISRDLTDEIRSNCDSLNGNRSNLEKHILKRLAEEEDFDKYMNYIHNPRDHFKSFIRDEVSQYITEKFSVSVIPKMKENIKLLQQKITKAAQESTEHVPVNSGDVGLWLKSFTQQLSDVLVISEKDLSGGKHDVDDFNLLKDVIAQELVVIMSDINRRFNRKTFPVKLDYKFRPDELLIDHFCQCCWVQCPFCGATCTNTIENHDEDHSVSFHRNIGQNGWIYRKTTNLSINICTSSVASDGYFYPNDSDDAVPWKEYRRAGGVYADWSITPDLSELPYWKWFVCRFQKDLEKYYNKKFEEYGKIPDEWRKYTKLDAFKSLDKNI